MAIVFFLMLACLGFGTMVGMVMVIVECFSEWLDHRKQPFKKYISEFRLHEVEKCTKKHKMVKKKKSGIKKFQKILFFGTFHFPNSTFCIDPRCPRARYPRSPPDHEIRKLLDIRSEQLLRVLDNADTRSLRILGDSLHVRSGQISGRNEKHD